MDFVDLLGDGGFGEFDENGEQNDGQENPDQFLFGLDATEMEQMKSQKDSVIFLIDCHKSMHERNPHNGAE